jgi:periplasmic protein TonB
MSREPQKVSKGILSEGLGSLRGCLVDGDAEQRKRQQSIRRRSLAISVAVQSAILTALILVSLFGKPQTIALANVTPIPPYSPYRGTPQDPGTQRPRPTGPTTVCHVCPTLPISPTIPTRDPDPSGSPTGDPQPLGIGDGPIGGPEGLLPFVGERKGPIPPNNTEPQVKRPRVVRITTLDPAMLIHRVEPIYPFLAKQAHREGRVEMRAVIGIDGTIQSLQVVSGDGIFVRSALEAVQQWHYKPTILNGQPVEIDTYITVVYTMQH